MPKSFEERRPRRAMNLLAVGLLLSFVACTPNSQPVREAEPEVNTQTSVSCAWSGVAPSKVDLTFVSGDRLFAISSAGTERSCLLGSVPKSGWQQVSWGPRAERILFGPSLAVLPSGNQIVPFDAETAAAWSLPEGKSILGVTTDGRLLKRRTIEPESTDVSFLKRHDEAVYHPAGRHIISVGVDNKGSYGVFLANNQGKDLRQLAVSEQARKIYSLKAHLFGGSIFYTADHGSYREVHSLGVDFPDLGTLYKTNDDIVAITNLSDQQPGALAIQVGSCGNRTSVVIVHWASQQVDAIAGLPQNASVEPVGWLPGGKLAVLVRAQGCNGKGDLYVAQPQSTSPDAQGIAIQYGVKSKLLVRGVEGAAVRAIAPPPPAPPRSSTDPPAA